MYLPADYSMAILDLYIYYKNDDEKMFLVKTIWLCYVICVPSWIT